MKTYKTFSFGDETYMVRPGLSVVDRAYSAVYADMKSAIAQVCAMYGLSDPFPNEKDLDKIHDNFVDLGEDHPQGMVLIDFHQHLVDADGVDYVYHFPAHYLTKKVDGKTVQVF